MANSGIGGDEYRSHLHGEGEKNTKWRSGAPPNYDAVNKLFEEGRTKVSNNIHSFSFRIYIYVCMYIHTQKIIYTWIVRACCLQIWPPGSLEEKVQNLVKSWEMELFNKISSDDYKTLDPNNYTFSLNGN